MKGGDSMIAMFWTQNIIYGRYGVTFDKTPPQLKEQVAQILKDSNLPHLITDEQYK